MSLHQIIPSKLRCKFPTLVKLASQVFFFFQKLQISLDLLLQYETFQDQDKSFL